MLAFMAYLLIGIKESMFSIQKSILEIQRNMLEIKGSIPPRPVTMGDFEAVPYAERNKMGHAIPLVRIIGGVEIKER